MSWKLNDHFHSIKTPVTIFWFRRDIRLEDNNALYQALKNEFPVLPLFIFDTSILDKLDDVNDKRVNFIYQQLESIYLKLSEYKTTLLVEHGKPIEVWKRLIEKIKIKFIYANHDYEPYAIQRDDEIKKLAFDKKIPFLSYKDHVIFEKDDILKNDNKPYTVYTPYSKQWKIKLKQMPFSFNQTKNYFNNFYKIEPVAFPSLQEIGFAPSDVNVKQPILDESIIKNYDKTRDFPALQGTTHLSVHLRFGTISIRKVVEKATQLNEKFLNELIWREFYVMILYHFPHVVTYSFKSAYDYIVWENDELKFQRWCDGLTGYPLVDAGMRELNETGYMHNRIRMLTASFLTKHLLIDWRWGEAYFAKKLLDYDLAANNGGWQWAAGCGCDAAPYFRIFNPTLQAQKFDKDMTYIKKWVPEIFTNPSVYPLPIVDHNTARQKALNVYRKALLK